MDFKLTVQKRENFGKKTKQLRRDGIVLGNVYGKGVDSVPIQAERRAIQKTVLEAGKNHPIELSIEGDKNHLVLVHEIERANITQDIHHVTFHVIKKGEKVTTEIPLHLVGDAPAARTGNVVVKMLDEVEIEADPAHIPEAFDVSIDSLEEVGDSISVSDIKIPQGVTLLTDDTLPIVKVEATRANMSSEDEDAEAEDESAEASSDEKAADTSDEQ